MPGERGGASVQRLRPIRVLLLGSDRRFLRVARVLLARAGCAVECSESMRGAVDLIRRLRINVVVLDASGSLIAAARIIAAIGALPAPVGVVAVADDPPEPILEHLSLLPKWTRFDDLIAEVEAAYSTHGEAQRSAGAGRS